MKQETLEEAAEKHFINSPDAYGINEECRNSFIEGAKWQQEQEKKLYSEEEVYKLLYKLLPDKEELDQWFEQFKKE